MKQNITEISNTDAVKRKTYISISDNLNRTQLKLNYKGLKIIVKPACTEIILGGKILLYRDIMKSNCSPEQYILAFLP